MTREFKNLNVEALRKLIDELASTHPNAQDEKFNGVMEQLREMNELLKDFDNLSPADMQETEKRILECQVKSKEAMEEFLKQYGSSIEEAEEYFKNPQNFSPKEWQRFQELRQGVESAIRPSLQGRSIKQIETKERNR
jgi:hypothetical protein